MLMRKRLDIQEAVTRPQKSKKILRLFISNTASDQPWQNSIQDPSNDSDVLPPNWTLRIEGRLVDPFVKNTSKQPPLKKMTHFIRSAVVELKRDPELYGQEKNVVEWHKQQQPQQPEIDGFEIKRLGDESVPCRIMLKLDYFPDKFRLSPALSKLLQMQFETRQTVIMALWQYIKKHRLQDGQDRRMINTNEAMRSVFPAQQIPFPQLNELISPHLMPMDPVVLEYTVRVDVEKTDPVVYDVEVEVTDSLYMRMAQWVQNHAGQREIAALDHQQVQMINRIHGHRMKREFMLAFAQDPVNFIQRWMDSQSRDLEVALGDHTVNLEAQRRAAFYAQPWVAEAVFHYLANTKA